MRTRIFLFVSATLLVFGVMSFAQPAAAAPAEPYHTGDCVQFGTDTYCYEEHGVVQTNESASGNTKYTFNGTFFYTLTRNGVVIHEAESKSHSTFIVKDGEQQVSHSRDDSSYTYAGETCTVSYNTVFANGEIRHQEFQRECS
jgi:hypothetical protein